ncbi:MAG: rRNA maturation RNase YbeY [Pararhizobium sp.]
MASVDIDIAVEAAGWPEEPALAELAARAVQAAVDLLEEERAQPFPDPATELSILFTSDEAVRGLNSQWRGKDKPTNVLSFPAFPVTPGAMPGPMLGDLVLARETIAAEASDMEGSFNAHLTHLIVHGFLHLLGYDHIQPAEAEEMEGLETRILARLGLSDPYKDSDPA